jgi:hypothetical protein
MADVSLKQWIERRIKRLEDKKKLSLKDIEDDELGYIERSTPYLYKVLLNYIFIKIFFWMLKVKKKLSIHWNIM